MYSTVYHKKSAGYPHIIITFESLMKNCLKVDDCIAFVSRRNAADALGVSLPTLREYQNILSQLSPKGWDYQAGDRGFTRNSLEVLASFRCMVQDLGKRQAILNIRLVMEKKYCA